MTPDVRQNPDPVLREIAKPIPLTDFGKPWVAELLAKMSTALQGCADGVALAAPQIGESWRVFVVGQRAFPPAKTGEEKTWEHDLVFINPIIVRRSRRKVELIEGCLSVRDQFGTVKRHERVSVEAYDQTGKKFTHHASGLIAQVFQHEIEHLDGILFIDQAWDLHELEPEDKHD